MKVQVTINNVKIIEPSILNVNEYNVHECEFEFVEEYNGLSKKAVFTTETGANYIVSIVNNKCSIPTEVLKEKEFIKLGVYAYDVENEELIVRYSPRPTEVYIQDGSYRNAGGTPPTPSEIEQLQAQITHNANNIEVIQGDIAGINQELVGINGELLSINGDIDDIKAEQTEQNTNIQKNTNDIVNINQSIDTINIDISDIDSAISDINENIDNLEQDLTNYSLIRETGSQINLNINNTNYQITATLKDKNGNVIYTSNAIDLPIESMIINASYDNTTKEIVLTLQNGNTLRISIADLVSGLVSETQLQTILTNYYTKIEVDNLLSAKANQSSLDTTNQNLSDLTGRVSTNEEDIADIKEEQTTQNADIEELQSQVETLQEDLESANSEIEELNTDITNMRKAMITVDGQGTDITLENTTENKFVEFGLEGRTEQATSILPDEYQQVEYIESTGTQYIDTGLIGTDLTNSEIELTIKNNTTGLNKYNFNGAYESGKTTQMGTVATSNTTCRCSINFGFIDAVGAEGLDITRFHKLYAKNGLQKVNNAQVGTKSFGSLNEYSFLLFARTNVGGATTSIEPNAGSSISLFTVKKNGKYIRYLVPCYRNSDNVVGMYDLVTNTFFINSGTGDFIAGNEITIPNPDFPQPIKNVTGQANVKIQNKNLAWTGWAGDFVRRVNDYGLARLEQYDNKNCLMFNAGAGYGSYDSKYMFKIPFKENTRYTFYFKFYKTQANLNICCEYTDGTISVIGDSTTNSWTEKIFTSSSNKTIKYIRALYYDGNTYIDLDTFMVLEGAYTSETIPSYVQHQEQNYPFTFASGQRLMQDGSLQDYGIHNIRKQVVLDGTQDISIVNWQATENSVGWIYPYSITKNKIPTDSSVIPNILCNRLKKSNYSDLYSGRKDIGISLVPQSNSMGIVIRVNDTTLKSKEAINNYLSQNPFVVEFELSNRELENNIIPYNATQQAQYNNIKANASSYDDITIISSESDELGFDMNVVAVADANKVIDSLDTRLLALESEV